jgi:hypothetical protein
MPQDYPEDLQIPNEQDLLPGAGEMDRKIGIPAQTWTKSSG